jgi:tripartite-type tricarboxylate transporter receptor subunit TctC
LDVINDNTDYIVLPQSAINQHIASGALTVLAVADDRASPQFPGVPTVKSLGYSTFPTLPTAFTFIAPRNTPLHIQKKITEDVATAVQSLQKQLLERKLIDDVRPPASDTINTLSLRYGKQYYDLSKKYIDK